MPVPVPSRSDALALDAADPLHGFPFRFVVADRDLAYFDGMSLGRLPRATAERLGTTAAEWGVELVRGWDHWIDLPTSVGDSLADLIGAERGEVLVCDSVTLNLYKLIAAVFEARPDRLDVIVAADEFPTDRYVLEGLAAVRGRHVRHVSPFEADRSTAVVVASAVDFRTGALADMRKVTEAVHAAGALMCWDLSHAVGSVPVSLSTINADLAVGCTYKHLCAGPGAPGFLYVRRDLQGHLRSPVWGWFAQQDQFAMGPKFQPVAGIRRFLAGTPGVLELSAVDSGVALVREAGIERLAAKARKLTDLVIALADEWLAPLGFELVSPRLSYDRGAHVAFRHPDAARIGVAARAGGVIVDVRPPDIIRVGPAPISSRFIDVYEGMARFRKVVESGAHEGVTLPARVP